MAESKKPWMSSIGAQIAVLAIVLGLAYGIYELSKPPAAPVGNQPIPVGPIRVEPVQVRSTAVVVAAPAPAPAPAAPAAAAAVGPAAAAPVAPPTAPPGPSGSPW